MRRRALWLAALLGVAACLWLFVDAWVAERSAAVEDGAADTDAPGLRSADGRDDEAAVARPGLQGNPDAVVRDTRHGPVEVHVTGPGGHPVPFAHVRMTGPETEHRGETDAAGRVVLGAVPYDGTWHVTVHRGLPPSARGREPAAQPLRESRYGRLWRLRGDKLRKGHPVTGGRLHVRVRRGHLIEVDVVEADSGRRRPDARLRWVGDRLRTALESVRPPARFEVLDPPTSHGFDRDGALVVDVPPGFVLWDQPTWLAPPSPLADSLRLVLPLRQSMRLTVPTSHTEDVILTPEVVRMWLAGRQRVPDVRVDGSGTLHLEGLPFFRNEPLTLAILARERPVGRRARARLPDTPAPMSLPVVHLTKDRAPDRPEDEPGYDRWGGVIELAPSAMPDEPFHTLRVRVKRFDDGPAARVMVEVFALETDGRIGALHGRAYTGAGGTARLACPEPGTYAVAAEGAGFLGVQKEVRVTGKGTSDVALQEPPGGTVAVEVVDGSGRGLPFATCHLGTQSPHGYADIQDGVQRLDAFTNHRGERTLDHVPPGPVLLTVRWGSRIGEVRGEVSAGETTRLRVVLKAKPRETK